MQGYPITGRVLVLLLVGTVVMPAEAGDIVGRRSGQFDEDIHESFIWAVGAGQNASQSSGIGFSWGGNYSISGLTVGQYWVVGAEWGQYPYNFVPTPVSVPSFGTVTLDLQDRNTMSSVGLTDLGTCLWAAQGFIATGRDLALVALVTPSGGSNIHVTIREGAPNGPQIGPIRSITPGSLFPALPRYRPGEVPLIPGRRYFVRFDSATGMPWAPALSFRNNQYPNGHAWIDGVPVPEGDLSVAVTCRDTGFIDGYRVNNWWRPDQYSEYVQTFRADGEELRFASIMLAGPVGEDHMMRASIHPWSGAYPPGAQTGPAKHAKMGANVLHGFVWGPGELPLTTGQQYAIRFVRADGQPYSIYGDSDDYAHGQAYFDGVPQSGIDVTGRLIFKEQDLGDLSVTGLSFTPVSATEVLATFNTDLPTTATVVHHTGSAVFETIVPASATTSTSHSITVRGLAPNTTYDMRIMAYHESRNVHQGAPVPVTTLNEFGSLSGRILSQVGPLADIEVVVEPGNLSTMTDGEGYYDFAAVPTGRHMVRAQNQGTAPATVEVDVLPGANSADVPILAYSNLLAGSVSNPITGWTPYGQFDGQHNSGDWGVHTRHGYPWLGSVGNYSPRTGGMYRSIATTPGVTYRFGAFVQTRAFGHASWDPIPGLAVARIGVDPTGGTNPNASSVQWKRYRFTDFTWLEQSVEFTAPGSQATLFIAHKWEDYYPLPPWFIVAFADLWIGEVLPPIPDFDFDGDVDMADFGFFQWCLGGPGVALKPGCEHADLDRDGDVDQADFAIFLGCLSGTDVPLNPICAE